MTETLWTVNGIKNAMRARGSHWFDPDTMKTFGTKVLPTVYQGSGGIFFVTQDEQFNRTRGHTVRQFDPETAGIATIGELAVLSKKQAVAIATNKATAGRIGENASETSEPFRPVSQLEQFLDDLRKHGNQATTDDDAAELIDLARKHHFQAEQQCNGTRAEIGSKLRERVILAANRVGAAGVIFSGDPRGCTVKLTFADGFVNDFAKEGYCVPTDK